MAGTHSQSLLAEGSGQVPKRTVDWDTAVYGQTRAEHSDQITQKGSLVRREAHVSLTP